MHSFSRKPVDNVRFSVKKFMTSREHSIPVQGSFIKRHEEKVLVIKDSFANSMVPYLAESFTEVHCMDLRYNNASLKEYIKKEGFTRVILLYGMDTVAEDPNLKKIAYQVKKDPPLLVRESAN